jgi:hypothetical protein
MKQRDPTSWQMTKNAVDYRFQWLEFFPVQTNALFFMRFGGCEGKKNKKSRFCRAVKVSLSLAWVVVAILGHLI